MEWKAKLKPVEDWGKLLSDVAAETRLLGNFRSEPVPHEKGWLGVAKGRLGVALCFCHDNASLDALQHKLQHSSGSLG